MPKQFRNKPDRQKGNRTRKEKKIDIPDIPHYVWQSLRTSPQERRDDFNDRYSGKFH